MWKVSRLSGKFQESLESFRKVWKVSGQSRKFSDSLESFHTVWKVSRQAGKFPVRTVWKVSGQFGMFLTVWKGSRRSGKFPDSLETFQRVWKVMDGLEYFQTVWNISRRSVKLYVAKAIYTLLAHICRENDLRTPSGKFLRVRFCRPESFDFLCLCLVPPSSSCFAATKRDTSLLYVDLPPSPGQTTNPQWCPLIEAGFQVRPGEVTKARTMG